MGDAGALVTDDADLAGSVRALREHGQREKYRHDLEGYTARLDTLQALVLQRKLPLLDGWNAQRRRDRRVSTADASRASATSFCRRSPEDSEPVWHLYVVRTADPAALGRIPRGARDRRRAGTTRSRRTCRPPTRASAYGRGAFPVDRGARRASCSRCRSSPA